MKRKEFDLCMSKNELIETGDKDNALAGGLLSLAVHKQQFWTEANLESKYPSVYLEGHYEIVKELATAILAIDGWKSLNHECLFAYLKEKRQDLEIDFDFILELKDIRNAIDYRGIQVSKETWSKNKLKINLIIKGIQGYLQKRVV